MSRFIPHWRKATWAIVIWTVLMALWIILGINNVNSLGPAGSDAEGAGRAIGAGIGVTFLFIVWLVGFIILSIVWFMSRPRYIEYKGRLMTESDARRLQKIEGRMPMTAGEGDPPTPAT